MEDLVMAALGGNDDRIHELLDAGTDVNRADGNGWMALSCAAGRGYEAIVEHLLVFAHEVRWPVVFHTGTYIHSDVLAVAQVARRFPDVTFVCDCAGFADMWFEFTK